MGGCLNGKEHIIYHCLEIHPHAYELWEANSSTTALCEHLDADSVVGRFAIRWSIFY